VALRIFTNADIRLVSGLYRMAEKNDQSTEIIVEYGINFHKYS
jgi:hypothetical protein